MARLRPLKKQEEVAAIPADKEVLIELPAEMNGEVEITQPSSAATPEPAPQPEPQPEPEPEEQNALQKQLEELKKAEALAQRQVVEARAAHEASQRQLRERDQQLDRERANTEQASYDAVLGHIGAAQAEADKAQADLETALAAQDYRVAAEAQRRLTTATTRLVSLEDGKAAYEARREERPAEAQPAPSQPQQLPKVARDWIEAHPEYKVGVKNTQIGYVHQLVVEEEGHSAFSPAYFESLETHLGIRNKAPAREEEPETSPQRRSPPVSAPVSREPPSPSTGRSAPTRVHLSPEQREAARIAGVDEFTYAKGVQELERRKKNGMYPDR